MYDIWIRPLGKGKTTEYKNVKVAALDQDLQELMDEEKTEEPISLVKAQELMAIRWAEHQISHHGSNPDEFRIDVKLQVENEEEPQD